MAIEQAPYTTLIKEGSFEIRQMQSMIIAVTQERNLDGNRGFSTIFNYISGDNVPHKKIAMTVPVINELNDQSMTTAFVMPKQYTLKDLPAPLDPTLTLKEVPSRLMACLTFSGSVSPTVLREKQEALLNWIHQNHASEIGQPMLARYNPPFIPGFLKRNEVMIEIEKLP